MKNIIRYIAAASGAAYLAVSANPVLAKLVIDKDKATGGGAIAQNEDILEVVFKVINWILLVVGAAAVLFLIIGGFRYITSAGNETQVEGAKNTMTYAIIGLVIVLLAYVIARTIDSLLA